MATNNEFPTEEVPIDEENRQPEGTANSWNSGRYPWALLSLSGLAILGLTLGIYFGASGNYMPHAHCYLFNPHLMFLHGVSDLLIGASYIAISATLLYLVIRSQDRIPFHWMMLAFAGFIVLCGGTHFMDLWTLQASRPPYWLSGWIKFLTAIASVSTACMLPPLVVKVIGLVHAAELSKERKRALDLALRASERKEQLEEQLRKEEILRREVHHRVKNNLQVITSLLYLQSNQVTDPKTLEVLRESQARARSIALIHEKLYQSDDVTLIDFADYVRRLAGDLFDAYRVSRQKIELTVQARDVRLDLDTAIPCGLILTELVSNALKYAFTDGRKGEIAIRLEHNSNEFLRLTVRDNGVGLPNGYKFDQAKTLGLVLVSDLTRQLGGKLEYLFDGGTVVRIIFPIQQNTARPARV